MPRIAILPDTLASQVAAGEVVERPSSVLKELVENCLDAGATHIEVEVRKGGVALMKVSDNGHGMDKENALLSLERHATSKLSTSEGLASIITHGFRGEALPSIASVARFKLTTNNDPQSPATEIHIEGGKVLTVSETSRAQGTTIEVKDLFYNVPARRKFLKSEATEYAHIEHALRLSALGNNEVRYIFKHNGRTVWDLKPTSDRKLRITELLGHESSAHLLEVPSYALGGIEISGHALPGRYSRGSGRNQTVFINKRPVDDPVIKSAIKDGYSGHIQPGQYPVVWLWINMPPEEVDVNVHPAKKEVRFTKPTEIKHVVSEAIASALSPKERPAISPPRFVNTPAEVPFSLPVKPADTPLPLQKADPEKKESFRLTEQWSTPDQGDLNLAPPKNTTPEKEGTPPTIDTGGGENTFTYIGSLKNRLWLLEDENGLVVIHPKHARARIIYEKLKYEYKAEMLDSQPLLIPLIIDFNGHDQAVLKTHLETFNELGIEINHFGGDSFQILSLPLLLDLTQTEDARAFIMGVIDQLESTSAITSEKAKERAIEQTLVTMSAQAVKHDPSIFTYQETLLTELFQCDLPYCAPDGKPTMIHYSENEIGRKFS